MEILGFTGTKEGLTIVQKRAVVAQLRIFREDWFEWVEHGDCVGGDEFFGTAAAQLGFQVEVRPGIDKFGRSPHRAYSYADVVHEPEPYLDRNHKIVDEVAWLLACPKEHHEELRSGTWATIRYARKKNVPVEIIYPT